MKNTIVKIAIHNGDKTTLRFGYETQNYNENEAKTFIFNTLNMLAEKQTALKKLGAKANFFGLNPSKENYVDIDIQQGDNVSTVTSGLTFRFSQIQRLSDPVEGFNIIFDVHQSLSNMRASIEMK